MIRKGECTEGLTDLLRLLRLSGRALASVFGTKSPVLFRWVDGTAEPNGPTRWAIARLASTARAASPQQLERLREMALCLPTDDGQAFQAMLDAAALWRLQQEPLVQVPETAPAKVIRMRDRKKPASARLSEAGLGGARRGTTLGHRTRATG